MANSPAFQPARTGTGSEAPILPISFGDEIGAGLVYSTGYGGSGAEDDSGHLGPGAAQFADGTPSYLGFALQRDEDVFYGWMRVVLTRNGLDGLLQSWAYDDSGVAIRAAASADPGAAPVILQAGETQTATVATAGTALMLDAGAEFTFSENSTGGIYTGNIMGYGELKIAGNGSLSLSGTNTFSGGTTLSAGVLRLESATGAGTGTITQSDGTSTIEIDTTGTVANAMNFHNLSTLQTVTLSGNKTLNNSTYTVASGTTTTESGVLSGIGGITKEGAGTLLVTGNNTFSGATEVNAGVLDLASTVGGAAASTSAVSVANGATLLISQNNQVNNAASVTLSGGTIRTASGVSEVFGNLNLTQASFLDFGTTSYANANTISFGTYTYNSTPSALLTINNFDFGSTLTFGSNLSTTDLATFSFTNGGIGSSSWDGSTFTITAIPEPSTYVAAIALLALMLWPLRHRLRVKQTRGHHLERLRI